MANHPFDVVGWDGMVYPYTFNADDFERSTVRFITTPIHKPFKHPVSSYARLLRMLDTHPNAIKVPYAHSMLSPMKFSTTFEVSLAQSGVDIDRSRSIRMNTSRSPSGNNCRESKCEVDR